MEDKPFEQSPVKKMVKSLQYFELLVRSFYLYGS